MPSIFQVVPKPAVGTATALHDGTNGPNYPPRLEGFVIQAHGGAVHFGDSAVTGAADGFTVHKGRSINVLGFLSRGSPSVYDLTQMYYVGGPWKLVIERQVK
jgi:hypothetical protein